MFSASADYYDLLYDFKDYDDEARRVAGVVRAHRPGARTLLDVACGTGRHAACLTTEHGFSVDGIDLEPRFIELARARNPTGDFRVGDMRDFQFGRTYDAVVCLFSSIGYVRDLKGLRRAAAAMTAHLGDEGVLLVEPWFEPSAAVDRSFHCLTGASDDVKVCRMSHSRVDGSVSRLRFEYLIGTAAGVERRTETHELGLFTRDEMTATFCDAGLTVAYDPEGLTGRGLYTARRAT